MNEQDWTILVTAILGFAFPPIWLVTLGVVLWITKKEWDKQK